MDDDGNFVILIIFYLQKCTSDEQSASIAVTNLRTTFNGCMMTDAIENAGLTAILPGFGKDGEFGGWPMVQDTWTDEKYGN